MRVVWSGGSPFRWLGRLATTVHALFRLLLAHGLKPSVNWH
jgi:hypothetical protein